MTSDAPARSNQTRIAAALVDRLFFVLRRVALILPALLALAILELGVAEASRPATARETREIREDAKLYLKGRGGSAAEAEIVQHALGDRRTAEFAASKERVVPDAVAQMQDHLARGPSAPLLHRCLGVAAADRRDADRADFPAAAFQVQLGVFAYFPRLPRRGRSRRLGDSQLQDCQRQQGGEDECDSAQHEEEAIDERGGNPGLVAHSRSSGCHRGARDQA